MNPKAKFIGLDVGTSSCKGLLVDEGGKILKQVSVSYPLIFTEEGIEQSPEHLWNGVKQVLGRLIDKVERKEEIKGIGVTSQGITFIPVDQDGQPLMNAISWLDTRAEQELEEVLRVYSEGELFKITGKRVEAYYVLPKLLWIRKRCPRIYEQSDKFLLVADFVVQRLTGEIATDHTLAGGTLLYDVVENKWAGEIMKKFEIPPSKFPKLRWGGEVIGYIKGETDLKGTPIVVAGQDQKCAAFAMGIKKGRITVSLGTASAISCLTEKAILDKKMRIPLFPFLFPNKWILEGVVSTAGASYEWAKKIIRGKNRTIPPPHKLMTMPFFLPHLSGASSPLWRKDLRGAFFNLSLATTAEDLIFAVLEGVAFEIRRNIEVMEELADEAKEVVVIGGGARSRVWRIILANVLGKVLYFPKIKEASALGASILAGGTKPMRGVRESEEPQEELRKIFEERYNIYRNIS